MEKFIDVVYKLGVGSIYNNAELRYSLRSLQNFLPLRNVYIVGFKPEWVQNIIHISASDVYLNNKDANLINKMILATQEKDLSNEFVNISDDQLFLQSCSYEDIKVPYTENRHITHVAGKRLNRWEIRLQRTIEQLKGRGYPTDCFESHVPCLLNKENYTEILFQYDYGVTPGYAGNTLYYNTLRVKGQPINSAIAARIFDKVVDKNQLEEMCKGRKFLNYTEKALKDNEPFLLFLQSLFPNKSMYEK